MNKEDAAVKLARECHLHIGPGPLVPGLEKFYQAAYAAGAAAEREACAELAFEMLVKVEGTDFDVPDAIRARGNT